MQRETTRLAVLMAGYVTGRLYAGVPLPPLSGEALAVWDRGYRSAVPLDIEQSLTSTMSVLSREGQPTLARLVRHLTEAARRAEGLLAQEANWRAVEALAVALLERRRLRGARVREIVSQALERGCAEGQPRHLP